MTLCALAFALALPQRFETDSLDLTAPIEGLAALDHDGDGKVDLLVARASGLELIALQADAAGHHATLARLERLTTRTLTWCVAPASAPGLRGDAVFLARDDGAILRWQPGTEPVELARATALLLPGGVLSFPFARDLNGDGRTDVALPEPTGLRLWFANADGTLRKGPQVRHRVEAEVELPAPEDARPEVAVSLSIPAFQVEDQNGDHFPDLAFESKDRLQFFWSGAGGALPETPTFEIDLDEIRKKLDTGDEGLLDPGNLFKIVTRLVSAEVRDLDGDGLSDLLLQQGPKVSLFAGTRGGVDRSKAVQVLKTSGNLIAAFPADDNGDGKLDLCMLQAADVSIGDLLLWVVVGGKIELDLFTYFQEERLRFAKHPSLRRRIVIEVPAILALAADLKEMSSLKRLGEDLSRVPVALDLDGDGRRGDVALLRRDGVVELYGNAAPEEAKGAAVDGGENVWRAVTERYDRQAKGADEVRIELLQVVDWIPLVGGRLRAAIAGMAPTATVAMPDPEATAAQADDKEPPATRRMLVVLDVDGDRKDDLLLVEPDPSGNAVRIELFRRR